MSLPPGVTLEVGDNAPEVSARDCDGLAWNLSAELDRAALLLVFFRGNWCFLSRRALAALRAAGSLFEERGCRLAAVSVEPPEKLIELRKRLKLKFCLLTDPKLELARAFGLPIERRFDCPFPAVFVLAPDGEVLFRHLGRTGRDWPDWQLVARVLVPVEGGPTLA
ncbi:MAG: redoxin domain-containing protein [Candidatus Wallbacteria bacterium]|nr:redoxin domain-containing protein [Candidatus Wallbacteria bacterium]